jgi:hypothetical protein
MNPQSSQQARKAMDESNLQVKAKSIYDEIFRTLHNSHNSHGAEFQVSALNLLRHQSIEVLEWIIERSFITIINLAV